MQYKHYLILLLIISISFSAFSCKNSTNSESDPLGLEFFPEDVSNIGGSDGSIYLVVFGGASPYDFMWSNGETSKNISNLSTGVYSITVTDYDGNTLTDSTTVALSTFDYNRLNDKIVVVEEDVYGGVNVTVFSGDDGNLIIDTGGDNQKSKLNNTIQILNPSELKYIINTHNHIDHRGGNSILSDGGTIIGHENGYSSYVGFNNDLNFIGVTDEYNFSFNGEDIRCFPLTEWGHTGTDIAVYFENLKILCLGDTYLSESFPSVSSSRGARVQYAINNYETILNNFPSDITLIPGHGRTTSMDELRSYLDMVNATVSIVRAQMAAGVSLDDAIANKVLNDYDQWGQTLAGDGLDTAFWIRAIYGSYF